MPALRHRCRRLKIAETAVGAAADEAHIHRRAGDRRTGLQIHVAVGLLRQGALVGLGLFQGGHGLIHADALARGDAPGHGGSDGRRIEAHLVVEHGVRATGQAAPPGHGLLPGLTARGEGAAAQVVERGLVGVDVAAAGPALDRHVAEGHALLHRERIDRRTGEFVGIAHAALDAEGADHVQHQILGVDAALQLTVHPDAPHLQLAHRQALAGQHVAHLTGADAERDRSEGAVGGGMGIAAGDGHARLGETKFGGDHVHDALTASAKAMQGDAVLGAVGLEGDQHLLRQRIGEGPRLGGGGHDVIHRGHGALGVAHAQAQIPEACEGLWAGDLMDQVQADEQLAGPAGQLGDPMQIPDLVVEGAGTHGWPMRLRIQPKAAPRDLFASDPAPAHRETLSMTGRSKGARSATHPRARKRCELPRFPRSAKASRPAAMAERNGWCTTSPKNWCGAAMQ